MDASRLLSYSRSVLVLCVAVACHHSALADSYYNLIDLGDYSSVKLTTDSSGQQIVENTVTGVSYPYPESDTRVPASVQSQLPGVNGIYGFTYPEPMFFQMQGSTENTLGTVLGTVPSGESHAIPWSFVTQGYAEKLPDGQYGSFVPLSSALDASTSINALNQILVVDYAGGQSELVNLNTNTTTSFFKLFNPAMSNVYYAIQPAGMGIADNGYILAQGFKDGVNQILLLTPPSLSTDPVPVPEPTTLSTIVIGIAGLVLRRKRSVRRGSPDGSRANGGVGRPGPNEFGCRN